MNLSFKNIKEKLVERLSPKYSKKQIEDAVDVINKELISTAKKRAMEKAIDLKEFKKTPDYSKMKNLSYWIFNNYGIPENMDCVFSMHLGRGFVLSKDIEISEEFYEKVKSGIFKNAFNEIISEYISEYTNGYIKHLDGLFSFEKEAPSKSIFLIIEKKIYPDYKFARETISNEWSEIHERFIVFKNPDVSSCDKREIEALKYAADKIDVYKNEFGDSHQPKLIKPLSGLVFDSINERKISEEAESWDLTEEELFTKVKECLDTILSNVFITTQAVYNSEYLMSFVLFRRAWYFLTCDNELVIVDMLDSKERPTYYGSGANELNA